MVGPAEQKNVVSYVKEKFQISERRSCRLFKIQRSTVRYQQRENNDGELKNKILSIAEKRPRFGSPRIHQMLLRQGVKINHKRTERLYSELNLSLKKNKSKRRYKSEVRTLPLTPTKKNEIWTMDFIHDALAYGRKFKGLTIVDLVTRESPAIEVDFALSGFKVVTVLDQLKEIGECPSIIKVDNGPEFIGLALDKWASENGVKLYFSRPGKPTDQANIESFNGKFRDECLNMHWFKSIEEAKRICEEWRIDYNQERPHSSLDYKTPKEFADGLKFMLAS